ncbi:class IV adenylate cyclase [Thermococcus sp.]|uniref:class IV adenylate cyclase n=1 Tax=Thermococcus sp. TaxID=35749 RepID=UPI002609227E|nr:class IV adenylate cyclase [Thermococcus sp.]
MIEIEVKGYANDEIFERVRERFEMIRREKQEDVYFQHPCRDFSRTDEALRIRLKRFDGHFEAFLTYKGPKIDPNSKTRKEIEVQIENPERHEEILLELGFRRVFTVRKTREKYHVEKGVIIVLDEVEGLGKFVEAEALTEEEENVGRIVEKLKNLLMGIGITRFERRSYLELLLEGG